MRVIKLFLLLILLSVSVSGLRYGDVNVIGDINATTGDISWTVLTDYPAPCPAGQAVQTIGDTLGCIAVSGGTGDLNWSELNTIVPWQDVNVANDITVSNYVNNAIFNASFPIADGNLTESYILANGTRLLTANWTAGGFDINSGSFTTDLINGGSSDTTLLDGNITLGKNYLQFPTGVPGPAHSEGQIFYDDDSKTFTIFNNEPDIAGQILLENWIRVRNISGATIFDGNAVFIAGSQGNLPTIELAIANSASNAMVIGIATHDIENNSIGFVTTFGTVRGLDTSAFDANDTLWLSDTVAGDLVNVIPVAPSFPIQIGTVIVDSVNNGEIFVSVGPTDVARAMVIQSLTVNNGFFANDINAVFDSNATRFCLNGTQQCIDDWADVNQAVNGNFVSSTVFNNSFPISFDGNVSFDSNAVLDGRYILISDSNNTARLLYSIIADPPFIPSTAEWDANYLVNVWNSDFNANWLDLFTGQNISLLNNDSGFITSSDTDTTLDSNATAREKFLARDLNWSGTYDFNGLNTLFNLSQNGDINGDVANFNSIDFGTNTIADGQINGAWAFNSGNLSGIGTISSGDINSSGDLIVAGGEFDLTRGVDAVQRFSFTSEGGGNIITSKSLESSVKDFKFQATHDGSTSGGDPAFTWLQGDIAAPSQLMKLTTVGLGIGTTPALKLDVGGSGIFRGNALSLLGDTDPTLSVTDTTNTVSTVFQAMDTLGIIGMATNHTLIIATNATTAITIDTSQNTTLAGNLVLADDGEVGTSTVKWVFDDTGDISTASSVGIGTLVPDPDISLHVLNSGTPITSADSATVTVFQDSVAAGVGAKIAVVSGNTGIAGLHFGDTDAISRGIIQYDNNSDSLAFQTAATDAVLIDSSQNFDIPTGDLNVGNYQVDYTDGNYTITVDQNVVWEYG